MALAILSSILIFWQQPFDFVDDEKFTFRCLYCSDRANALGIARVLATIKPRPTLRNMVCARSMCVSGIRNPKTFTISNWIRSNSVSRRSYFWVIPSVYNVNEMIFWLPENEV